MKNIFLVLSVVFSVIFVGAALADTPEASYDIIIETDGRAHGNPMEIVDARRVKIQVREAATVMIKSIQADLVIIEARDSASVTVDVLKVADMVILVEDNATVTTRQVVSDRQVEVHVIEGGHFRYESIEAGTTVTIDAENAAPGAIEIITPRPWWKQAWSKIRGIVEG